MTHSVRLGKRLVTAVAAQAASGTPRAVRLKGQMHALALDGVYVEDERGQRCADWLSQPPRRACGGTLSASQLGESLLGGGPNLCGSRQKGIRLSALDCLSHLLVGVLPL
jgi:hypothetical protein